MPPEEVRTSERMDHLKAIERRRSHSNQLFGSMDRLGVAVAIASSDGVVNPTYLSWQN
jgi:hypothetical protein